MRPAMFPGRRSATLSLLVLTLAVGLSLAAAAQTPESSGASQEASVAFSHAGPEEPHGPAPSLIWVLPFVALLLAIAILPLIHRTAHWWEHNPSKLKVALALAAVTCVYYLLREHGFHGTEPGLATLGAVLQHSVLSDYIPFIVLLFSLYTISGGINLRGDLPAHPLTNTAFLAIGAGIASFVGTTGASMVLIRPLLQTNSERRHVKHTVIFFIFLVSNVGGLLLPIGDPPLFLGYLRGVPFLWTLNLVREWALCVVLLLAVYFVWDTVAYRREEKRFVRLDEAVRVPLRLRGNVNFILLLGVVLAVALLVPGRHLPGTQWTIPEHLYLREIVQMVLAGISMLITPAGIREANKFNFVAITEVAFLFIGIFITMQPPIEILQIEGPSLGLHRAWHFFWATGTLSSFLDNAPTYVVYFETAKSLPQEAYTMMDLHHGGQQIAYSLLAAISCGAVFMGANTYIGNGPNFMVKSIAEQAGVKMPSFFGYMAYSMAILLPIFLVITFLFFRG
jgi:Na+/H+ antiporter NhaD/arsenite permease-like protein